MQTEKDVSCHHLLVLTNSHRAFFPQKLLQIHKGEQEVTFSNQRKEVTQEVKKKPEPVINKDVFG